MSMRLTDGEFARLRVNPTSASREEIEALLDELEDQRGFLSSIVEACSELSGRDFLSAATINALARRALRREAYTRN